MAIRNNRAYQYTLQIGAEQSIKVTGRQIVALEATGVFQISLDDDALVDFEKGLTFTVASVDPDFRNLRIKNNSGGVNTVKLRIGYGDVQDNRLAVSSAIDVSKGGNFRDVSNIVVAATSVGVATGSAAKRRVALTNTHTTITVWANEGSAAAVGVPIPPGETRYFKTTASIGIYNPGGSSVTVARVSEED